MVYMNTNEIEQKLKEHLKPGRYRHTVGVAYTAASMAMAFEENLSKAYRAGLLHDCAKGYALEEQSRLCEQYNIMDEQIFHDSPQLMHSALAPYIAKEFYEESDEEILSAIQCHTTGKPAMTNLEKIIFIADYIEPNRKMIPGLTRARKLAFTDLNDCTCFILKQTIDYLKSQGNKIGHQTIETYEYYRKL